VEAVCQKERGIGVFFEPLILYLVLFFPGLNIGKAGFPSELSLFSISRELSRITAYNIPALALIWYLLSVSRSLPRGILKPGMRDLKITSLAFPALVVLGFLLSLASALVPELPGAPELGGPRNFPAAAVMVLSCLSTGYLEESYFRFYLFTRFQEGGIGRFKGMLISSAFFALCHIYEGLPGAANAFLAGLFLYLLVSRRRAIHGFAWAHGLYNVFVYVMAIEAIPK
jgi:membrane protease YdiL (CAAX protease family)